ncbi:MAG: T9SS type A sorting domain-containing protein, partial [Aequorivita sp.]|nr:T9SS type A sorting domain-containing protein [Aequorivita sp.]
GTFTVPSGTIGGETRMRVSMKYNGIPTSCETFSYGEVEDYTINLGAGAPDTQAPTTPSNLVASNVTQTTLTLSWNASTDNVGVTGYDVFQGTTNIGSVTGTSANITGLSPSTAYSFKVRAHDAAGNNSGFSNTVNVTTPSNTVTYCTSQGNNSNDEYIDRVQLGSINNLSGNNGGYADFTSISTSLAKGSSNTITITPRWTGTVYREAYRVWIDYNQDGDFNDSGEQVYSRSRTTASSISGSFTVPTSALSGATRMRVSMKYNANPSSCETFTYGEVEDYTVIISNAIGQGITGDTGFSNAEMSIYPNPAKHTLNISLIEATGKDYVIYNTVGQVVGKGAYTENVDVSSLQSGIYIIEVNTENNKLRKRFVKE